MDQGRIEIGFLQGRTEEILSQTKPENPGGSWVCLTK